MEAIKQNEIWPIEAFFMVTVDTECMIEKNGKESIKHKKQRVLLNADSIPDCENKIKVFMKDEVNPWKIVKIEYSNIDCVLYQ